MNDISIAVISPINASYFAESDAKILSEKYNVTHIKVSGTTKIGLIKSYLFDVIPAVIKNDISYIWFADAHAFVAAVVGKIFRKKVVIVVGGYEISGKININYGNQISKRRRIITNAALKLSTLIINQSFLYVDKTREIIGCGVPTISIHPPVDTSRGEILIKERSVAMVASGTKNNEYLKGIDLFNFAAREFNKDGIPFYLIGNYDEDIKERYSYITFVGKLPHKELLNFLGKVKVYCQLSRAESFGVSLVEAMSRGCIPVITDIEALPEVVSIYGNIVTLSDDEWTCAEHCNIIKDALDIEPNPDMFKYVQKFSINDRAEKLLKAIEAL